MVGLGTRGARKILENKSFRAARVAISLWEARREHRYVRHVAGLVGTGILDPEFFRRELGKEGADTFFILGSGASVEDLTKSDFERIRRGVSVGINAWPLHSFVPDFYTFEPVSNSVTDHFQTLGFLKRHDILAAKPRVLVLRPRTPIEREQFDMIPAPLKPQSLVYGRTIPFTRQEPNLAGDLANLLQRISTTHSSVVIDSGASVIRMASLGILMGFEKIVFVGVDLRNTNYFWERNPDHLARLGLSQFDSGQKTAVHETMSPVNRPFAVIPMVKALDLLLNSQGERRFYVASAESALADIIPVFEFKD